MTILFVSHKLEDVEGLCDRVVVLRQGHLVGGTQAPYDTHQLVEMMFGKEITLGETPGRLRGRVVLSLHELAVEDYRLHISKPTWRFAVAK